jgi:copper transport protein
MPGRASAHANVAESEPAANSVMPGAPSRARIRFTEPVEPSYSRVALLDESGATLSTAPSQVDPGDRYVMLLDLPALPHGRYALEWRALSTADGHTTRGRVPFAIGDPAAADMPLQLPPPAPDPLAAPPTTNTALRWLLLLAVSLVAGSLIFGRFVCRAPSGGDQWRSVFARWSSRLETAAAGVAAVAAVGMLVDASWAAQTQPLAFAANSRVGMLLAVRALLLAALAVVPAVVPGAFRRALGFGLCAAALLSISLLSHSAAPPGQTGGAAQSFAIGLAIAFDWIHLLATAAWIGGLLPLLLALTALRREDAERRARDATLLVARFTALATTAVIALAASGSYAALHHIWEPHQLWTTTYGRALSLKLALFGVLLLLAAYNRWRTAPRIAALEAPMALHADKLLASLRRSVAVEIAVGAVVLLAVGVLTAAVPAHAAEGHSPVYVEQARTGQVRLALQIAPGGVAGDIYALDVSGLPAGVQPEAVLRASMQGHDMGQQELDLVEVEPGRFGARGSLLAMSGAWQVEAIVRARGMDDVRHTFVVDTAAPAAKAGAATPAPWVVLLVLALLAAAAGQLAARPTWRRGLQGGSLAALLLAVVAVAGGLSPFSASSAARNNPVAATDESIERGRQIYGPNCASCHGFSGRGDGPAGLRLRPRPADFRIHMAAGHTDAQLFDWITNGVRGTAMPAFGGQLSEEQIWDVVNYIRTFAQLAR